MRKKATIQDIADALGISRNTVSKAINNSDGIADATREKILQKAVEMGYKQFSYFNAVSDNSPVIPYSQPRNENPILRGEIALLTTMFLAPSHFASLMLDKFQRELAMLGYTLNTHRVTAENVSGRSLPITLFPERCSGIICFEIFDKEYAEMLCALDIPILFVDGPARIGGFSLPADQLSMDNATGISCFVNDMLRLGYHKIGWIGNYRHCQSFYERYLIYRTAMMIAGIPVDDRFILCHTDMPSLKNALISLQELPDVFICANDFTALDSIRILNENGKKVPDDVMFCGFDDSPESRHSSPALTTVHIHTQIMAYSALQLLLSRIQEPSLDYRLVYTEADLIYRESANPEGRTAS